MTPKTNSAGTEPVTRYESTRNQRSVGLGTAHAKAILAGEHAVLYGHPAIAIPMLEVGVQVRLEQPETTCTSTVHYFDADTVGVVDEISGGPAILLQLGTLCHAMGIPDRGLRVSIENSIPYGRGLGSSAAVGLSLVRALADLHDYRLTHDEQLRLVGLIEKTTHGKASGVDAATVGAPDPRIRWFDAGRTRPLPVHPASTATLLVVDSGEPSSTAHSVQAVATLIGRRPRTTRATIDRIGALVHACAASLESGDTLGLGAAITENHSLLRELNLSTPSVDQLVADLTEAGALGAKVSGGGRGGCVVAVFHTPRLAHDAGRRTMQTTRAAHYWAVALRSPEAVS